MNSTQKAWSSTLVFSKHNKITTFTRWTNVKGIGFFLPTIKVADMPMSSSTLCTPCNDHLLLFCMSLYECLLGKKSIFVFSWDSSHSNGIFFLYLWHLLYARLWLADLPVFCLEWHLSEMWEYHCDQRQGGLHRLRCISPGYVSWTVCDVVRDL